MARPLADVTETELAVLETLWNGGSATVRQIAENLYPQCTSSEHATVQKLLDRLRGKQCVERDAKVWPHKYSATIDRGQLISHRLESVADTFCGGALQPLLSHLVRNVILSAKDRKALRALLEESEHRPAKGNRSIKD